MKQARYHFLAKDIVVARSRPDAFFSDHTHNLSEIGLVLSGAGVLTIGGRGFPVSRGDLYVCPPGMVHGRASEGIAENYVLLINIDKVIPRTADIRRLAGFHELFHIAPHYLSTPAYRNLLRLRELQLGTLLPLLDRLLREFQDPSSGSQTILFSLFTELAVMLIRYYEKKSSVCTGGNISVLAGSVKYIEEHFCEPLALAELADLADLSKNQYLRVFKSIYRMTPFTYIIRRRLDKAKYLLEHEARRITDVIYQCGFNDPAYFSRVFKKYHHIGPRDYLRGIL